MSGSTVPGGRRSDSGVRVIRASPDKIFAALIDPAAVARWRPPTGMSAKIHSFDAREGGSFRISFIYDDPTHSVPGKTAEHVDTFSGTFFEIVPGRRVVERVTFHSADPAFAEPMTITTSLRPVRDGTEVAIVLDHVPDTIDPEDHRKGIASTLENLAAFTE